MINKNSAIKVILLSLFILVTVISAVFIINKANLPKKESFYNLEMEPDNPIRVITQWKYIKTSPVKEKGQTFNFKCVWTMSLFNFSNSTKYIGKVTIRFVDSNNITIKQDSAELPELPAFSDNSINGVFNIDKEEMKQINETVSWAPFWRKKGIDQELKLFDSYYWETAIAIVDSLKTHDIKLLKIKRKVLEIVNLKNKLPERKLTVYLTFANKLKSLGDVYDILFDIITKTDQQS